MIKKITTDFDPEHLIARITLAKDVFFNNQETEEGDIHFYVKENTFEDDGLFEFTVRNKKTKKSELHVQFCENSVELEWDNMGNCINNNDREVTISYDDIEHIECWTINLNIKHMEIHICY